MNTLMATAAALVNLAAVPSIVRAEQNKRRNSAVFLLLLMAYGLAHNLTSSAYTVEPLVYTTNPVRYQRIDYSLVVLFIFFSDEFHTVRWRNSARVLLIAGGFLLGVCLPYIALSVQWSRFLDCFAQCFWRLNFFQLISELQQQAYK